MICLCMYPGLSELWVEGQRKIPKRNERIQRESEPQVSLSLSYVCSKIHRTVKEKVSLDLGCVLKLQQKLDAFLRMK